MSARLSFRTAEPDDAHFLCHSPYDALSLSGNCRYRKQLSQPRLRCVGLTDRDLET
jgi:hypothetical protein